MSEFSSVLELAQEVVKEANRIKQGEDAEKEAKRVLQRVLGVEKALADLRTVVAAARRLHTVSGEQSVELSNLDEGRESFARSVANAGGQPRNEVFTTAVNRIGVVTQRVTAELAAAWTQWAERKMAGVPRLRISQLDAADQREARSHWDSLVKASKVATPTTTHIIMFKSDLDYLHEVLDPLPDLDSAVQALYERLGQRPALTLADLTDEQITVLKKAGLADLIEVRRRGA